MQQIQVEKTLDVEFVEHQLAELWTETAGHADDDSAVLRARVANLLVYVPNEALLNEVNELMQDVTVAHPSRALVMLGETEEADRDIDMFLSSLCQTEKRTGAKRLCGEVVVLKARGKFSVELPSAALPLLVSDLTTFLWWRNELDCTGRIFNALLRGSDRLVIDSDEFVKSLPCLLEVNKIFDQENLEVGVSDLNWARLTLWRGLLADFYDVPTYQALLDDIDHVRIDYVAPSSEPEAVAPQAILLAGWLASRLGWTLKGDEPRNSFEAASSEIQILSKGAGRGEIKLELNRVERSDVRPGRLVEVHLHVDGPQPAFFSVRRSTDGIHVLAEARVGAEVEHGRVLPVRNRSLAQLLSREMEIITNDDLYQQALEKASNIMGLSTSS
ncbi:MAG TPA: glucose-6-phosphate dehydrogenase assembly protein OpcA [Pyrinomonadaceae bacterium]|nr:glucose-6-phosphate dehydrogenase assembly protein OpcA [Pyrinomonadaceae bacterium]